MAYPITSEVIIEGDGTDPGKVELSDSTELVGIQCPTTISSSYSFRLPSSLGATGSVFSMLNSTDTGWVLSIQNVEVWMFTDEKTSGTDGGTFALTTWVTRELNTVSQSPSAGTDVQLAVSPAGANQLLVQPGTYMVFGYSPSLRGSFKTALWNDDTSNILIVGTSEGVSPFASSLCSPDSYVIGVITVAIQTVMSYRMYSQSSTSGTDLGGFATGIPSVPEIYTRISFYKL